jgi:hypothetical protein
MVDDRGGAPESASEGKSMINIYAEINDLCDQAKGWASYKGLYGDLVEVRSISVVRRYVEETLPFPIFTPKPTREDVAALLKHYDTLGAFYNKVSGILSSVAMLAWAKENKGACPCYERAMDAAREKREQEKKREQERWGR